MGFKFECPNCGDVKIAKYLKIGDSLACGMCAFDFHVPDDAEYIEADSSIMSHVKVQPENPPYNFPNSQEDEPRPSGPTPWGAVSVIKFGLASIVIFLVTGICLGLIVDLFVNLLNPGIRQVNEAVGNQHFYLTLGVPNILYLVIPVLLIYYSLTRRHGQNFLEALNVIKPSKKHSIIAVAIALGISLLFILFRLVTLALFGGGSASNDIPIYGVIGDSYLSISVATIVAFTSPFAEEVIFRGYMFRGLKESFGQTASAIFVTIFSILLHGPQLSFHFEPMTRIAIVAIALIFLRIKTNNVSTCMIFHFIYNLVIVIIIWTMALAFGPENALIF